MEGHCGYGRALWLWYSRGPSLSANRQQTAAFPVSCVVCAIRESDNWGTVEESTWWDVCLTAKALKKSTNTQTGLQFQSHHKKVREKKSHVEMLNVRQEAKRRLVSCFLVFSRGNLGWCQETQERVGWSTTAIRNPYIHATLLWNPL